MDDLTILSLILGSTVISALINGITNYLITKRKQNIEHLRTENEDLKNKIHELAEKINKTEYKGNDYEKLKIYLNQLKLYINPYGRMKNNLIEDDSYIWEEINALSISEDKNSFDKHKELLCYYLSIKIEDNRIEERKKRKGESLIITDIISMIIYCVFAEICIYVNDTFVNKESIQLNFIIVFMTIILPYVAILILFSIGSMEDNIIHDTYSSRMKHAIIKLGIVIISMLIMLLSIHITKSVYISKMTNIKILAIFNSIFYFIILLKIFWGRFRLYIFEETKLWPITDVKNKVLQNQNLYWKKKVTELLELSKYLSSQEPSKDTLNTKKLYKSIKSQLKFCKKELKHQLKEKQSKIKSVADYKECSDIEKNINEIEVNIKRINNVIHKRGNICTWLK